MSFYDSWCLIIHNIELKIWFLFFMTEALRESRRELTHATRGKTVLNFCSSFPLETRYIEFIGHPLSRNWTICICAEVNQRFKFDGFLSLMFVHITYSTSEIMVGNIILLLFQLEYNDIKHATWKVRIEELPKETFFFFEKDWLGRT